MTDRSTLRVDALRGLASFSVALYHVRTELWVGWGAIQSSRQSFSLLDQASACLGVPMRFFGVGVLFFFVLSGFCIHSPQAKAASAAGSEVNWPRFLVRRFFRIYPPYLAAIGLSVLVLWFVSGSLATDGDRVLASIPMVQNYWRSGGQISVNPSLWSLPVELELYLVYPLAWWLGRHIGWNWVLLLAISISLAGQLLSMRGVRWLDGSFPSFWGLWCAGAWVAERRCRDAIPALSGWWNLGLTVTILAAVTSELVSPLQALSPWLWGGVGVMALCWAVAPRHLSGGKVTRHSFSLVTMFAGIGTFSYSLYLIHYPLFHLAGHFWVGKFGAKPSSILVSIMAVLGVLPLAWVFHRCVEAPSHRLARKLGSASRGVVSSQ
jgi:peptidoglycan/LPS O-acetylase OafA/YrhL